MKTVAQEAVTEGDLWRVPVAPLLEAIQKSGLSYAEVARRIGWKRHDGRPDSTRIERALGVRKQLQGRTGKYFYAREIKYEIAVLICREIGAMPVDVGV